MRNRLLGTAACLGLALVTYPAVWLIGAAMTPTPGRLAPEVDPLLLIQGPAGASSPAKATFRVVNSGGSSVEIRSVRSGCDCAVPRVEPRIVPPGEVALVEVTSEPPEFGERSVVVTLVTDSPVTPEVDLHLQLKGREQTPDSYLLRAGGDLTFMGEWTPEEPRQIIATTVQAPGEDRPPRVECDLPFLEFDLVDMKEKPSIDPAVAARNYTYQARFVVDPPRGRFQGVATVVDPWDESRTQVVRIHGETPEPIQVIPPRLILRVGPSEGEPGGEAILRLRVRAAALTPSVTPEAPESSPIVARSIESAEEGVLAFVVGFEGPPESVAEGVYNLVVHPSPTSSEPIVVPVMVRTEDQS